MRSDEGPMSGPTPPPVSESGLPGVVARIAGLIPEWYGPGAHLLGTPQAVRRPWSIHLLPTVETIDLTIGLVVKIPLWEEAPDLASALQAGPQAATRGEFEALQRIETMIGDSGDPDLTAVRPVAYVADLNAVVTELLDARPLRRLAQRGRRSSITGAAPAIGRWLRRFHDEIGDARDERFDPATLRRELAGLAVLAEGGPAALRAGVASLGRIAGALAGGDVRVATTHGDFGPSNVLVDPDGRIGVIDPNLVPGPVEQDAAKLAVALRTGPTRLISGIRRRPGHDRFERGLLGGYGRINADIYRLCRGIAVARRWADVEGARGGTGRLALLPARRVLAAELTDSVRGAV